MALAVDWLDAYRGKSMHIVGLYQSDAALFIVPQGESRQLNYSPISRWVGATNRLRRRNLRLMRDNSPSGRRGYPKHHWASIGQVGVRVKVVHRLLELMSFALQHLLGGSAWAALTRFKCVRSYKARGVPGGMQKSVFLRRRLHRSCDPRRRPEGSRSRRRRAAGEHNDTDPRCPNRGRHGGRRALLKKPLHRCDRVRSSNTSDLCQFFSRMVR